MTPPQPFRELTSDEIKRYDVDGVVCIRGAISPEWVESLRLAAQESLNKPSEMHAELAAEHEHAGRFFHDSFIWRYNENCHRFVFESPAAQIARQLMRSQKINIFYDQWLIKEPGTETPTPWHHDLPYWPIDGSQVCTLWLALDTVTATSGAVEFVKGSHRWGKKLRPVSFGAGNQYTEDLPLVPSIDAMRQQHEIIRFDLEPGDCTVHHGLTIHGASGNASSNTRRRAYTSRWTGDDVVFHPRDGLQEMPPIPAHLTAGAALDSDLWPRVQ